METKKFTNPVITFEWDEIFSYTLIEKYVIVIDRYEINIISIKENINETYKAYSSPYSIIMAYNVEYTVRFSAINCAGRSEVVTLHKVKFGK